MNELDAVTATARVALAKTTLVGFLLMLFGLLALLVVPGLKVSPEIISLVSAAVGSLGTILAQQHGYYFGNQHRPAPPDSNNGSLIQQSQTK